MSIVIYDFIFIVHALIELIHLTSDNFKREACHLTTYPHFLFLYLTLLV